MFERLIVLGGGGWFPAFGRHTACAILRDGDSAIMIDAGTGVGRLIERPELLEGVERLDILLTHFHLDHIAGLAYLPAVERCSETTVWGPGEALYETKTEAVLDRVSREPFHPVPLGGLRIEIRDLPLGELEVGGVRVQTRRQERHSAPTMGLRFDDVVTWITDTAGDPESAAFAAGSRLLAHEAWFASDEPRNPEIHSSARQAAEVAAEAEIDQLLLVHMPPFEPSIEQLGLEAQQTFPRALIAHDDADLTLTPA
jgi:ribonuclease BN (tRNA processing enzyme)